MAKTEPAIMVHYSDVLLRLRKGLDTANIPKRGRNSIVAKATGYSLGMVGKVLSGHAELTSRFIQAICSGFGISREWIEAGTGEILITSNQGDSSSQKTPLRVTEFLKGAVAGTSLHNVAIDLGISESEIGRYMDGVGYPSADTLLKLSKHTGLPVEFFVSEGQYLYSQWISDFILSIKDVTMTISAIEGMPPEEKWAFFKTSTKYVESLENLAEKIHAHGPEADIMKNAKLIQKAFFPASDDYRAAHERLFKKTDEESLQPPNPDKEP